jgi:hypothetical protein
MHLSAFGFGLLTGLLFAPLLLFKDMTAISADHSDIILFVVSFVFLILSGHF